MSNVSNNGRGLFVITTSWAAIYPLLLLIFGQGVAEDKTVMAGAAMFLMFLLPPVSLYSLRKIKDDTVSNPAALRMLLFVVAATPPAYILTGTVAGLVGLGRWQPWFWAGIVILWTLFVLLRNAQPVRSKISAIKYNLVKKVHRISAFLLVFGFIGLHLINHLGALVSAQRHEELRLLFRSWYASDVVEPFLFLLLIVMMVTGIPMVLRYMRTNGDIYRTLQIGSGIYLVFFLCAHVNAVLSAQLSNVETDWVFATGEQGLIRGYYFLIPYYILSVSMVWLHVSCGIRMVMLGSRASITKANHSFRILVGIGFLVTVLVGTAVLGIQI